MFDWCGELEKHLSRFKCETIANSYEIGEFFQELLKKFTHEKDEEGRKMEYMARRQARNEDARQYYTDKLRLFVQAYCGLQSMYGYDKSKMTKTYEMLKTGQKLKGAKIFTSIDACGVYHAIQIEEGSRDCTAFISPFGTFPYIRMPFGLSNGISVYSQMLDLPWRTYL